MKYVITYILVFLSIVFWVFRVAVCTMESLEMDFMFKTLDFKVELLILFATVPCVIAILRRNIVGVIVYFAMNVSYFGTIIYNSSLKYGENFSFFSLETLGNMAGIIIPVVLLIDMLVEVYGEKLEDPRVVWYYKDKKYNRRIDKRVDRNQYKIK